MGFKTLANKINLAINEPSRTWLNDFVWFMGFSSKKEESKWHAKC
jgi:hypothetical protein